MNPDSPDHNTGGPREGQGYTPFESNRYPISEKTLCALRLLALEENRLPAPLPRNEYEIATNALKQPLLHYDPPMERFLPLLADIEPPTEEIRLAILPESPTGGLETDAETEITRARSRHNHNPHPGEVWASNPTLADGAQDHPRRNATPWAKPKD